MLFVLVIRNRQNFRKTIKTKVNGSRRMAWAFTRLRLLGVCRYLNDVDEVISPRFFVHFFEITITQ